MHQRQRSEDALGNASLMRASTGVIGPRSTGLTGTQIFTYLVSPTLKLGATSLLNQTLRSTSADNHEDQGSQNPDALFPLPIPLAVLALFVAATLNALAVQIWLMLGQYLRRWSFEGVVGEAFVGLTERRPGTRRNPWKRAVVRTTKVLVVLAASLLCAAYLRESTDLLVPLVPKNSYTFERVGVALILGFLVVPFFTGKATLNSKRIIYSNLLSILLYVIVGGVVIAHRYQVRADNGANAIGSTEVQQHLIVRGPLKVHLTGGAWEWLDVALFAFANQFFTFPLFIPFAQAVARQRAQKEANARQRTPSASTPMSPTTARRNKRKIKQANTLPTLEFFFLSFIASLFSVLLISLPFFLGTEPLPAPSPNPPTDDQFSIRTLFTLPAYIERTYNALRVLQAAYLLLGIPPLWLSVIKPRLTSTNISFRWVQDIKWHWVLFVSLISLASFAPSSLAHFISRSASLSFIGFSFLLPALLHVTVHTVRSPLSIIYSTSTASRSAGDGNGNGMTESEEALLRKKERSLQKRRSIRRVGWDLAVWLLLLPVGVISWSWWAGRVVGAW